MFDVLGMCTVSMGKLGYKSVQIFRFLGIFSYNRYQFSQHSTNEFAKRRLAVCIVTGDTILISILLEILCNQGTLTMNH